MGKELKNIDELYRSELGGSVTQAPDFVKKNIDSALGFRKRKTGYLLLGLIALLTTVGITAVVITNMDGADQVAQSNMEASNSVETIDNTSTSNNTETELPASNAPLNTNIDAAGEASDPESTSTNNVSTINTNNSNIGSSNYAVNNNDNQTGNDHSANRNRFTNQNSGNTNSNMSAASAVNTVQPDPTSTNTVSQNSNGQIDNTTGQQANNTSGNNGNSQLADNNASSAGDDSTQPVLADNSSTDSDGGNTIIESNSLTVDNSTSANDNTTSDNPSSSDTGNDSNDNQVNSDSDSSSDETNNTIAETSSPETDSTTTEDTTIADTDDANDTNEPPTVIQPPVNDDYKPLMISLTSGVNVLRSNYTSESMNEETLYENALNDRIGNQTNLDITYRLKNGLTFGSGLGLNNYDESYDFTTYETYFDTTEVFETIIYDTSDFPVDTVYTYAYDVLQKGTQVNGRNKASYFTLPVHLGTQMRFNKFQLDLYATARFNFLVRSSGGYYSNNEVISFGKENSIYKPFYVDVLFASKVHYNLLKNLYLTGTVQYRPVMGNSFKEVSFNKTFDYMHFGLGLSLRL